MENPNPTYLIEHFGAQTRVTVRHAFTANERIEFTVMLPSGQDTLQNIHSAAFGRLRELLALLS